MPYDPQLDAFIKKRMHNSVKFEAHVGDCLLEAGIPCTFQRPGEEKEFRWRPDETFEATKKQKDIHLFDGRVVEVKAPDYYWTSKRNFPFNPLMVETVRGFDEKEVKPIAYVNVSQKTLAKVAFWVDDSRETWIERKGRDDKAGYESMLYWVSTDWLVGWELFLDRLYRTVMGFSRNSSS